MSEYMSDRIPEKNVRCNVSLWGSLDKTISWIQKSGSIQSYAEDSDPRPYAGVYTRHNMRVSKNRGTPKLSIYRWIFHYKPSILIHFGVPPIHGKPHISSFGLLVPPPHGLAHEWPNFPEFGKGPKNHRHWIWQDWEKTSTCWSDSTNSDSLILLIECNWYIWYVFLFKPDAVCKCEASKYLPSYKL